MSAEIIIFASPSGEERSERTSVRRNQSLIAAMQPGTQKKFSKSISFILALQLITQNQLLL